MKNCIATILALIVFVPAAVSADSPDRVFRDLEGRISHAVITRDVTEMTKLFADDYTSVGISGQIRSRAEIIEAYSSGRLAISAVQTGTITVRQYGDIAIVIGFVTVSGKDGGTDISGRYAFTRAYRRDSSGWRAISFQATLAK